MKYKWTQKKQTLEVFSIRRKWNTSTKPNLFKAVHGGKKDTHLRYPCFLEFIWVTKYEVPLADSTHKSVPTFFCYKYLHPKIKNLSIYISTLCSGTSQSTSLSVKLSMLGPCFFFF